MPSRTTEMEAFRKELKKGAIQTAYRALLGYIRELRLHFQKHHEGTFVSALYPGQMDMAYFALIPPTLEAHRLKIALVFDFDTFHFEAWLAGRNRTVQRRYWELMREHPWPDYRLSTPAPGVDSILECNVASELDLDDPEALTATIESGTLAFIAEIEDFLAGRAPLLPGRKRG